MGCPRPVDVQVSSRLVPRGTYVSSPKDLRFVVQVSWEDLTPLQLQAVLNALDLKPDGSI